jgi:hypothetical protein
MQKVLGVLLAYFVRVRELKRASARRSVSPHAVTISPSANYFCNLNKDTLG